MTTPWRSQREEGARRALQFMHMRLEAEPARQLSADSGLSYPDYVVLVALTDRPDGRMRVFELAQQLGWETSGLSQHVGRMADRGVVKKEQCESDWRGAYVAVTKRGRKEIEARSTGACRNRAVSIRRPAHAGRCRRDRRRCRERPRRVRPTHGPAREHGRTPMSAPR